MFEIIFNLCSNTDTMMWNDPSVNTIALLLVAVTLWIITVYLKSPKNLPPGLTGIPILGYLPFLGSKPHLTLTQLKNKYGDIFTFHLGPERVVVLSSFKVIKEAFLKQGSFFEERPESFKELIRWNSQTGLTASVGAPRIELRRFTLSALRNIGIGKASMEPKIQEEINCLIEEIKKLKGKPTDLHKVLKQCVTNTIFLLLIGKRMEYSDKTLHQVMELCDTIVKAVGINQWARFLPQILIKFLGISQPKEISYEFYNLLLDILTEYYESQKDQSDEESFINAWKTEATNLNPTYTLQKLSQVLVELFIGGTDTTSTTLEWCLLYLIKYPEVQTKLQQEIDNVIGKEKTPTMSDQKLMPYTEATIMEISRISSIVPFSLPHCTPSDATLEGYFIPKDTTVLSNLWAVHMNPETFPEPECFKPERFLTEDNKIKRVEELIPFSIGKRQCVGESLARMQLFLILTALLQHFTFTKDGDVLLECPYAVVLAPRQQKINAILR